ncbi:FAD-binding oxidoreductase [Alicyclobacillus curvatus]|nr:FAD-binding oxidoreductase [Alicyclobacillus curvatus]
MDYRVIVIGGGIIGTSTAYYLSQLGVDVVLVESRDIAAGTSGSCDRAIMLQSKTPGPTLDLAVESAAMYKNLEAELDANLEYREGGGMILIETAAELEAISSLVERQRSAGLDVQLLSGEEARRMQPELSEHILGSTWWSNDAEVNPLNVSFSMARKAAQNGAQILLHTHVTGLIAETHRVTGVETSNGDCIYGDAIIVTTGVWTPKMFEKLGVDIPIIPRRGQILVSERVSPFLHCTVLSGAYIAAKLSKERATEDSVGIGLSMGQTGHGQLLIGGSREFAGFDLGTSPEVTRAIAERAVRVFPHLANVNIIRTFSGLRPYTPDGKPIISDVPQWPGLYIAAGHEGDGIALAPVTGKLAARMACGLNPGRDLSPFSLSRFDASQFNASQFSPLQVNSPQLRSSEIADMGVH